MSRRSFAILLAAGLGACGGSGSPTGPSPFGADRYESMVVLSQSFEGVEAGGQRVIDFSLPRRGTLALTVRWNDQNNSVVAALAGSDCFNFRTQATDCQPRHSIERQGKEGREGVIDHPNAGGGYRLVVENEGPGTETISVTAELTAFVPPPPPSPYPTDSPSRPSPRKSWEP